eukprot:TRINITY_DN59606_c0_g1_i1.p1 TRINITY_DN59606_c0_g1~~TRINITY_DN59606_c0_g1_i1.p1  ORF type:complete len:162 (-),score=29.16 TRINITY_DN59606_c0_g1_i1:97-582(-)
MLTVASVIITVVGILAGIAGFSLILKPVPAHTARNADDPGTDSESSSARSGIELARDQELESEAVASGRFTGIRNVAWGALLIIFGLRDLDSQGPSHESVILDRKWTLALLAFVFAAVQAADVVVMLYIWTSQRPQKRMIACSAALLCCLAAVAGCLTFAE